MLEEIAQLTDDERTELLDALPTVLRKTHTEGLSVETVRRTIEARERIRARLLTDGLSFGSVEDDLDMVRDGRLNELDQSAHQGNHA
jgi:hypothetical protein